ncbi:F-box/WD repeat-containing protein 10 [Trematomus bernacchii]|uniref:F-box/WD repeat-containing protein 10 n=1 Tax=Trematomus bernacchii TaxID=40690 RepID=UPI00146ED9D3|nr:F-box/WD repeat-containing protein 10 [Trematomus bernacchii]
MKSAKFGITACDRDSEKAEACLSMCGMCPSCVFAPMPPASNRCWWTVSDEFKRRFVVELLLRCRNVQVLESIQSVLGVTSWTLLTYARSRSPTSPEDFPCRGAGRSLEGRPLGVNLHEIWDWFTSSPDWIKSRYLCRLFSLCDSELLRMLSNLTSVLLVRQQRGFLRFNGKKNHIGQHDSESDVDSEDPALMVVPGSAKSASGVSRYRDFIRGLPVDLSKRILGLLDENSLRCCLKVCPSWQHLAKETIEEIKFRRYFQDQIEAMMKKGKGMNKVSSTYANIVEVPVPIKTDEKVVIHARVQKVKPFEAAYAKIKAKMVPMEERNVYCGAYFTKVLLDKEDPHRVVDYRGGLFMATGSKDRLVHLLHVGSETKMVSVMKGHVGSVRAVLLCEDRELLITASCDASIRCWCLKTDRCVMMLYGHTGTVNCLGVHADRLVSGGKDCLVKVWSLHTGKIFEDFHFKHTSPVQCVRINMRTVFSSCDRGFVKIWDMENALLLRVIDAHRSSVRCLFFDEWHFLSGDTSGQVMAWSLNCGVKECLMTFPHPKEVKSMTLVYLRVITGCVDGKIRIFNFLTGDCLREITAEAETVRILSLHFHDNRIIVNATSGVKLYQFAKVFWEYSESAEGGQGDAGTQNGLVSENTAVSLRKLCVTSAGSDHTAQKNRKKSERAELLYHTRFLPSITKAQARERCVTAPSVMLSEKATSDRIKRRGLHHPLSRDSILLKVNAIHKAQCRDEVSINMECNARLRDSWGPDTSQDSQLWDSLHTQDVPLRRAKTCVPILNRDVSQNMTNKIQGRAISTAPDTPRRRPTYLFPKKTQPHSADTFKRVGGFKECTLMRSLPNPDRSMKTGTSLPRISPVSPFREQGGLRLLTVKKAGRF